MKKNVFVSVLCMLMMLCLAMPAFAEAAPAAEALAESEIVSVPATVKLAYADGSLNLRSGEGSDTDIVTSLSDGQAITVVQYGEIWSKVATEDGKEGYIKNLYINDGNMLFAAGTEYLGTSKTMHAYIGVTLHAGASGETAAIATLQSGAKVTVLGVNGTYSLVSDENGAQGFVKTGYLAD